MNAVIQSLMAKYNCQSDDDYRNALKEIIQDVALLGLWRSKFFEHAAFYGGTALRILYGLNRFSEDLDFMLLAPNSQIDLRPYHTGMRDELQAFGFEVLVEEKKKTKESSIRSAFLKANTQEHVMKIGAPKSLIHSFQAEELVKVKMEIDTDPSEGFVIENRSLLIPIPFWVRTLELSSLFAGKLHAVLCRQWGKRVKGRDWFDLLWFVNRRTQVNLAYLEAKMRQTAHYQESLPLTGERLRSLLMDRVHSLDIERAKEDVVRFIGDPRWLEGWSREAFKSAVETIYQTH